MTRTLRYMNNTEITTTPVTELKVGDRFVAPNGVVHTATEVDLDDKRFVYVAWRSRCTYLRKFHSDETVEVVR